MNSHKANNTKITALYERLSRDDEQKNESISIAHQKQILENYAQKHGFTNIRHFSDDGVTGTIFNRPGAKCNGGGGQGGQCRNCDNQRPILYWP